MHRNIAWDKVENPNPQSTPQVLPSFEEYTPPVTYPEEVEENLGTPIEIKPLNETQLEELGLNTCNHDIPLSSKEFLNFDKTKPQPQPLPTCPPLDISLGDKRGLEPQIKPHSPDSFTMKQVDHLTNNTPPSPHVTSFHPKDTYCHYHSCIGNPKKHYGFKPGLLGLSGSLGVDFSRLEMIGDDWELESKEVSFLGRGLNSPVRPKEVENVKIKETHRPPATTTTTTTTTNHLRHHQASPPPSLASTVSTTNLTHHRRKSPTLKLSGVNFVDPERAYKTDSNICPLYGTLEQQLQEVTPDPLKILDQSLIIEPMHKDDQDENDILIKKGDLLASLISKTKMWN
ncbi:hypothetical protein Tco_0840674 [Tanacetum coccineum]|uniref:Uncharacterized protein n=1 Tax=Tanacetum coccineum TaxID=301880 RepID=A0ABQ5AWQ6_9ASTR